MAIVTFLGWCRKASIMLALSLCGIGNAGAQTPPASKPEAAIDMPQLLKSGTIAENVLGRADAPVTIVEYASMTCPHCATFHLKTFSGLKKDYIDTGKVRFIFRDFPFDGVGMAATMLARCADPAKFFDITHTLFERQEKWAFGKDPESELKAIGKEYGFSPESFDACLQKQDIYEAVLDVRERANSEFKVDSTPTLFVNGVRHVGALTPAQMEAAIRPYLTEKK